MRGMCSTIKDGTTLVMHRSLVRLKSSELSRKFTLEVCKHTVSAALLQVPSLLNSDDALPHDLTPGVSPASLTLQLYVRYTGADSLTDVVISLSGPDGVQLDQVRIFLYNNACCCL